MQLTRICAIQSGYTARQRLSPVAEGGATAVQLGDVRTDDTCVLDRLGRYDLTAVPERYLVRDGDVLFRSRGDRTTASAVEGLVEPAVAILPLMILRPRREAVEPRYLAWAINQPPAQRQLDVSSRGTSLRMIPRAGLDSLELDIPDLTRQRAIVALDELAERERGLSLRAAEKRRQLMALHLGYAARETKNDTEAEGAKT